MEKELEHVLREKELRLRELENLVAFSHIVEQNDKIEDIIDKTGDLLCRKVDSRGTVGCRIVYGDYEYKSPGFTDVGEGIRCDLTVFEEKAGFIQVFCSESTPDDYQPKQELICLIAGRLSRAIERLTNKRLKEEWDARYRFLVNKLEEGMGIVDEEENITFANPAFAKMLGYSPEELVGMNLGTFLPDPCFPEIKRETKKRKEGNSNTYETEVIRRDGTRRTVRVNASPYTSPEGRFLGTFGLITDITEEKAALEALKAALEEKKFLLKEINHRIKNNLLMVSSLINLKKSEVGDSVDLSDLEHQIDVIRLVHEKLSNSEDQKHIDCNLYIREFLDAVFSGFTQKKVRVDYDVDEVYLPSKTMVPLGLIINEIATNSMKYGFTAEEPVFSLSLKEHPEEGKLELRISDNGDPFPEGVDLDNPETLGLRLISALVEQIHGTVELVPAPHPEFIIRFLKEN